MSSKSPKKPTKMSLVWLITGTSSGLGSEFVKQTLLRGDKVIATARNASKIDHFQALGAAVMELDVTASQAELNSKAVEAISVFGRVDVLVNNAGYMQIGTLEEMREEEYTKQFNTNVFGPLNTARAILPHFRARGSGTIVNIGSSSAWESWPCTGVYSASKAALRYATDALGQEISRFGVKTLLVEPGIFRTEILNPQNSMFVETSVPDYQNITKATFSMFHNAHGKQSGDPARGVARIIDVVKGENDARDREWPSELPLGSDAVAGIRRKCEATLKMLAEWEDFCGGLDFTSS